MLARLTTIAGFSVVAEISDSTVALERIKQELPDVVILDIGMPIMDGYVLARRIRAEMAKSPRLVAVTGYGKDDDKKKAGEAGIDVHFTKPVSWPKLELLLTSYLNGPRDETPA